MATMTVPAMAKATANVVREALAEQPSERSPLEREALVKTCDFLAGLFRGFLQGVNESLAKGVGSRSLIAKLNEGVEAGAFALEQSLALQRDIDASTDVPAPLLHALQQATLEIERVHGELVSIAEWVGSPPLPPSLEKLQEASKGPFVSLKR